MKAIRKIKEIIKKTPAGRLYLRRRTVKRKEIYNLEKIPIWSPDAVRDFGSFPEMKKLWSCWIRDNEINNCGDFERFYSIILNLHRISEENVSGAFAELGVYKGNSAEILKYYAQEANRRLYLYDTFSGFSDVDLMNEESHRNDFKDTSESYVRRYIGEAEYRIGYFPDTIEDQDRKEKFAFVSLDCDLYNPIKAGLEFFYPRLSDGGMIFCHDYSSGHWEGVKRAVDEFSKENCIRLVLLPDKSGTVVIAK